MEVTGSGIGYIAPIVGHFDTTKETMVAKNNYYLEEIYNWLSNEKYNAISKTEEQMKTNEFLTLLNTEQENDEIVWKFKSGVNNGYPVLDWQ